MNKYTLSIFTVAIAFSPLSVLAQAQNAQTSIQTNSNSAAAIGNANLVLQNANQASYQNQINHNDYSIPITSNTQTAVQGNVNEAATVGNYNVIGQDATQTNVQGQVDINQYLPQNY